MNESLASLSSRLLAMGTWLTMDVGCAHMTIRDFLIMGPGSLVELQPPAGLAPESLSSPERGALSMRSPYS